MTATQLSLKSGDLQNTVQALRALRSEISRAIARLEQKLPSETPPMPTPAGNEMSGYTLFGQTFAARDGSRIFVEVLRHFGELDPQFADRYAARLRRVGRKRPYVARARADVYPGKPKLLGQTVEFAPGWFVGTNESNATKLKLLRIACDVLGLRWQRDLTVRMP